MPIGTDIVISEGTLGIAGGAFNNCSGLTSISLPEGLTNIGNTAFGRCSSLISVTIPSSVTIIENGAFYACTCLSSINIPSSVTRIGLSAFDETAWYYSQPVGLVYAGKVAYKYKGTMPDGTAIDIEEGTKGIADNCFYNCGGLFSVNIPSSVIDIGNWTFQECKGLTSVTIPMNVKNIGYKAFDGCSNLTSVKCMNKIPLLIKSGTFSRYKTLYVPTGCKAAYEAAEYWKDFKEIIETNTINVGNTGFATYCSPFALDFSEVTSIKAFIASGFNPTTGTLVLTRVTEVPASEGLYIVGSEGSYEIPETTTDMFYSNLLKGVTTATTIYPTDGDNTNFILANGSHGVGFYTLSTSGELAAGKAYLQLPTASVTGVKALKVILDDESDDDATSIKTLSNSPLKDENIFNLAGQRLNKAQKGINIINGKKVFIK